MIKDSVKEVQAKKSRTATLSVENKCHRGNAHLGGETHSQASYLRVGPRAGLSASGGSSRTGHYAAPGARRPGHQATQVGHFLGLISINVLLDFTRASGEPEVFATGLCFCCTIFRGFCGLCETALLLLPLLTLLLLLLLLVQLV